MRKVVILDLIIPSTLATIETTMAIKGHDIISVQNTKLRDGTRVTFVQLRDTEDLLRVMHSFEDVVRRWEDSLC